MWIVKLIFISGLHKREKKVTGLQITPIISFFGVLLS
jgi:hypothetical protein